ncbi:MAG: hypothetical protein IJR82_05040 [Bacilli bacterium]|nr:hypothetical protein [Bacilli bacterium]
MTKNDYKELDEYLNLLGLAFQKYDDFFVENIIKIHDDNEEFLIHYYGYEFEQTICENNLTFDEVFNLAREIIENINPKYVPIFDNLLDTGELDFNYSGELEDSFCNEVNNVHYSVDINRRFNYTDICSLIHEFFHYIKKTQNLTVVGNVLKEFFSIYFENFSIDYLVKKGIPISEIDYTSRLKLTFARTDNFECIGLPLVCFFTFGSTNNESYIMLKKYLFEVTKKDYQHQCNSLLDYFRRKRRKIESEFGQYNSQQLQVECCNDFSQYYQYFYGTLLAFYARSYCQVEDIIYLNDHVNDSNINTVIDFLKKGHIDMNDAFLEKCIQSIDQYINDYNIKQR